MSAQAGPPSLSLSELQPKMQLRGTVTRVELFGAFVDVGAEREGFVHISLLRQAKVNRVEDVIQVGQAVDVWVHRVEPSARRLELTMVRPVLVEWKDIRPGLRLKGEIVRIEKFGAFVEVGAERPGLVHVSEMSADYVQDPMQLVKVGQKVEVSVLDVDRSKRQIRLSMKEVASSSETDSEEEEEQLPNAMEVALRQALDEGQSPKSQDAAEPPQARPRDRRRRDLEDILSRTLEQRVKTPTAEE